MTAKKDGLSRTPSVLCGELMERQEGVLFGGVRMVGSCFISNPALASITNEKARRPFQGRRASCRFGFGPSGQRFGRQLLRRGAPSGAAVFDEAEAPHPLCWPVWGRGGKFEVDEIGAAARGSGVAGVPDGAVAGEMGEELHHRDLRAVFGSEPGEAIGALSRATSTGDPDDDVGVGGEDIRARHEQNITRTHGREKVVRAWAPALAIEAEGGDARAAPFTRARSALNAETPNRRRSDRRPWICARQRGRSNSR